jgi:hypothetical protein
VSCKAPGEALSCVGQFQVASRCDSTLCEGPGHAPQLRCVLSLLGEVPAQLIVLSPADNAELVVAKSTIEEHLAIWRSRERPSSYSLTIPAFHSAFLSALSVAPRAMAHHGITVKVEGLSGWQCPDCNEVEFDAESAHRCAAAGDELVLRHRAQQSEESAAAAASSASASYRPRA